VYATLQSRCRWKLVSKASIYLVIDNPTRQEKRINSLAQNKKNNFENKYASGKRSKIISQNY
jgi:hypothetical protein